MSLKFLTDNDFFVDPKNNLMIYTPGIMFLMFKSDNCEICKATLPIFDQLSKIDKRLSFGIVAIDRHRNIIEKAKSTSTPIKGVPTFILYFNGKPLANYKGNRTIQYFTEFLNKILSDIAIQQKQQQPTQQQQTPIQFQQQNPNSQIHQQMIPPPRITDQQQPPQQGQGELLLPKTSIPYNKPYEKI